MVNEIRENIIKEARRIEEDGLYSAKGHFVAADFWTNIHLWIGVPTAILAAIAGASALSQFNNHNVIAGILAIVVAALTAVTTFLNPNEKANIHLSSGNSYNALKNKARIFCEIDSRSGDLYENIISQFRDLANQRDNLNKKSPQIPRWAFKLGRKGIEEGQADYRVDEFEEDKKK